MGCKFECAVVPGFWTYPKPSKDGQGDLEGCGRLPLTWPGVPKMACIPGHGGDIAGGVEPISGAMLQSKCEYACAIISECTAYVMAEFPSWQPRACYLRTNVSKAECQTNTSYWTYFKPS